MATDNRSIVITLKLDNGSDDTNVENQTQDTKKDDKDATKSALAKWATTQLVTIASNEIVAWAEYDWNKSLMLSDDYIGQRNKTIAMTQINRGIGAISGVVSSAALGNAIAPGFGAAIGAVIGLVTQTTSIIRSNLQGADQQNIAMRQIDAGLDFTRSRAGYSLNAASIGEDL